MGKKKKSFCVKTGRFLWAEMSFPKPPWEVRDQSVLSMTTPHSTPPPVACASHLLGLKWGFLQELLASLVAQTVKSLPALWETCVQSLGQKIPWRRKWQPTPVVLPRESHRQRSLVGYSPGGCKESDTTERLHFPRSAIQPSQPSAHPA